MLARHIALRTLRLLRAGRDRIEPDVGEDDHARAGDHAAPAELPELPGIRRNERMPIAGMDIAHSGEDEEHDHRDLEGDDDGVRPRGLADTDIAQDGDRGDDEHRGNVQPGARGYDGIGAGAAIERGLRQRGRQMQAELRQQTRHVARPPDRDGSDRKGVLQNQVPADEPGKDLAERGMCVGVRAPRHRNHRGELRVTECHERAAAAGDDEREHQRRAGLVGRGGARQHENAGPDDGADSEGRQAHYGECAPELRLRAGGSGWRAG